MPHPNAFLSSSLEGPEFFVTAIKKASIFWFINFNCLSYKFDGKVVITPAFHARGSDSIPDGSRFFSTFPFSGPFVAFVCLSIYFSVQSFCFFSNIDLTLCYNILINVLVKELQHIRPVHVLYPDLSYIFPDFILILSDKIRKNLDRISIKWVSKKSGRN